MVLCRACIEDSHFACFTDQAATFTYADRQRERRSNLDSLAASSNGGEDRVVQQILQDVLEFGQLPKELNNPKTETDVAERKLAERIRKHKLLERAQEMLEKSCARQLEGNKLVSSIKEAPRRFRCRCHCGCARKASRLITCDWCSQRIGPGCCVATIH